MTTTDTQAPAWLNLEALGLPEDKVGDLRLVVGVTDYLTSLSERDATWPGPLLPSLTRGFQTKPLPNSERETRLPDPTSGFAVKGVGRW